MDSLPDFVKLAESFKAKGLRAKKPSEVDDVIKENPKNVELFKSGKDKLFGFFVGQVMKKTDGKANPKLVNDILKKKLN